MQLHSPFTFQLVVVFKIAKEGASVGTDPIKIVIPCLYVIVAFHLNSL